MLVLFMGCNIAKDKRYYSQFRNINLDQFLKVWERKVSNWVLKNRHKVFLFLFIAGVLAILPSLPYVNLIFPRPLQIFLTLFLLLLIFNISQRKIIFLAVILLLFAIPVLICPLILTNLFQSGFICSQKGHPGL